MGLLWTKTVLLLAGVQSILAYEGYKQKDGIYQLLDREIDEAARRSGKMVLMYYVPWCQHYHKFYAEFLEASKIMAESDLPIKFAMFNSHDNEEMTVRHEVFGSPTIKYFVGSDATRYDGERDTASLVKWLHKKLDAHAIKLLHKEHFEWLRKESEVLVAYFGKPGDNFEVFRQTAKNFSKTDVTFVYSHSEEFIDGKDRVLMYKVFDEPKLEFTDKMTVDELSIFVQVHRYPIVMPFDFEHGVDRIFTEENAAVIFFSEDTNSKEYAEFRAAAEYARGHLVFTHSTVKKAIGERLANYVGINRNEVPSVWIIQISGGELFRYHLKKPITQNNVLQFAHDFLEGGKLERELKSEDIVVDQTGPVKQLVGKNYNEIVKRPGVHTMAMIYAPWCVHSSPMMPLWKQAAESFTASSNIQFVQIDGTLNEVPGVKISNYPTLLYYHAKNKTEAIPYSKERNLEGIKAFLKDNLAEDWDDAFLA